MLHGLYAITDTTLTPAHTLLDQVEQAILGGIKILQLRDKCHTDSELLASALDLKALCSAHGVIFIMNDRLELAQQVDADGIHLGQHDLDFSLVRRSLPDKIIGVSCYGDLARAEHFQDLGADYVAFGACFKSSTKPLANPIPASLLHEAKQNLHIPICAIGGITLDNASVLVQQGADMLAVINDLWSSPDVFARAKAFSQLFDANDD